MRAVWLPAEEALPCVFFFPLRDGGGLAANIKMVIWEFKPPTSGGSHGVGVPPTRRAAHPSVLRPVRGPPLPGRQSYVCHQPGGRQACSGLPWWPGTDKGACGWCGHLPGTIDQFRGAVKEPLRPSPVATP